MDKNLLCRGTTTYGESCRNSELDSELKEAEFETFL